MKFLSKNGKKWSSRYAMVKLRVLRGTRCSKISEISPDFLAIREAYFSFLRASTTHEKSSSKPSNLHFEGLTTFRSHPEVLKQVRIIFSSAGIRQNRIASLVPVASDSTILRHQDNGDDTVRMHFT
ncbi:hypothetical protein E3N88_32194 [Mikania micrantha]|uniref:Uncharacterized protein n=1 Tax=Mikania micrantha TaxID=192012 RepID=A0A5N6M7R0_9ASTR|nr:hypothetical protein E3N88_32194 [Mikania micrantha]